MYKLTKKFDEVCDAAEHFNNTNRTDRFHRIFEQRKKYFTVGLYDAVTKKHVLFDSINLVGNFRYNNNMVPSELFEMEQMVASATKSTNMK
jgi:hypothetical protein